MSTTPSSPEPGEGRPQDGGGQPQEPMGPPQDWGGQPQEPAGQPHGWGGQPQGWGADQGWGGQPQGYGYAAPREHAPGAVASLVLGILGLFTIPLILSIIAVVLGNQSKRATAAEPQRYNDQLGQVGRILGWIGIGLAALGILALLAVLAFVFPLRT